MHAAAVHPLIPSDIPPPQVGGPRRASAPNNTRRSSQVSPAAILSRNKSTKSLRDRRRSSGALSTHTAMQKSRKCIGEYYVGKTLGKGASGRVKLGIHRHTGEQVAIKIISKSHLAANPAIEKAVRREIALMKLITHPNVMGLIDVIDDENSPDLHLVLEYVEGGELFEYLVSKGRLSENEARRHFQHIIMGLDYCHHHLICHRDLKPENLLLDRSNNIKIADFGMASLQPAGSMLETSCGSPHYASPEIVAGMPYNGAASDIWSCGVILYALLTGHLPFDDDNIRQLLKKVKAGKYVMPDNISRNAQDLIRRILVVDPNKRLNMKQIMAHPWFRETPINMARFPIPPSPAEIGQPISDPSEIDDRIVETIKFLWGESNADPIISALVSNEPNMQKVVYVLLQQHAEKYWQMEHDDDEDDVLADGEMRYRDVRLNSTGGNTTANRRHRSVAHRSERDRRCMSMTDQTRRSSHHRPAVPWMPEQPSPRRYSAVSMRVKNTDYLMQQEQQQHMVPPVPVSPAVPMNNENERMKKSQTFYDRFVRGVLLPGSRRSSKDRGQPTSPPPPPPPHASELNAPSSTLTGTLRRKNPFTRSSEQRASKTPSIPPKSTLRGGLLQRNKIDPSPATSTDDNKPSTTTNNNTKRLSIRIPNSSDTKKFGGVFTLTSNSRRQRKQLDMSAFEQQQQQQLPIIAPTVPPGLSDGSTLSSSSSSSSSDESTNKHHAVKTSLNSPNPLLTPPPSAKVDELRRGSQASFQSYDRRGSEQRPLTPSLLSNSSTITTSPSGTCTPSSPAVVTIASNNKASWITHLFHFKQPKVCSVTLCETRMSDILRKLHSTLNKVAEARLYEKTDKYGARYKVEIKQKTGGKVRQVKCRMDFIPSSVQETRVQFTQQQGDALFLASILRQVQEYLENDTSSSTATAVHNDSNAAQVVSY
ncbi:camk camkl gin4 protein kinase [Lichtheimia corymbifera JMRC:FSU:9682]|uniref:Camk camkl gin4 protein kinase n=1 Tax=Lichtheimia corymbifera JMRC:FSU:9682 TaxID=1263082 RepID=A0A068RUA2_9FUNG|nr:camk camkl gin4 protein kinase [Lichtheimia corymbifera JMRC:FSU:9682]